MRIINKTYKIDDGLNKNIVLISDIHYGNKNDIKQLNKILIKIKEIKPDYICIPGDITNKTYVKDEDLFINWLRKLSKICRVVISIGNHELCISERKKLFGFNEKLYSKIKSIDNIYVLDNESIVLDNINFIGLTLPSEYYYKYHEKKDPMFNSYLNIKTNKKYYNILLCHSPFNICNEEIIKKLNVNLILCGHMHGGIVPNMFRFIFKSNGFISPHKKLFPKNVYGNIKIDNTNIIITSGISVLPNKLGILRNLMASEIVIIKQH